MFTGIVEEIGTINKIVKGSKIYKVVVESHQLITTVKIGSSIAVNGVCLTVSSFTKSLITFDVMPVTIEKTNLFFLKRRSKVNLESALTLGSGLDGHIVSGHVDKKIKVKKIIKNQNATLINFEIVTSDLVNIVEQGSVCIDGVSLTIAEIGRDYFQVSIIPTTAKDTVLQYIKVGDFVNVEWDIIGKYINNRFKKDSDKQLLCNLVKKGW